MSLINEALKKAQKVRTGDPAGTLPPTAGGEMRVAKRGQPRSTQQLLVLAAGGLALVVLSVVVTFWIVNRAPAEKPAPKTALAKSPTPAGGATPEIVAPAIKPPVVAPAPESPLAKSEPAVAQQKEIPPPAPQAPQAIVAGSHPSPTAIPPPTPSSTPATSQPAAATTASVTETHPPVPSATSPAMTTVARSPDVPTSVPPSTPAAAPMSTTEPPAPVPTPAPVAATPAPPKPDDRVRTYVDALKVGGIRSSGGDSRVLMDGRVFRVNEIVERNFGLRLTKVESDALTFTDANGAVYVKNF